MGLVFSTADQQRQAALVDLESEQTNLVVFNKSILGVVGDERGDAFVVIHDRQPGSTSGISPGDDEYLERNWGVTIFDVEDREPHLILTEHELDEAAHWSTESGPSEVYMTYAQPDDGQFEDSHRDIVYLNLTTSRKDEFRLPSRPDGLGIIEEAGQVFINQVHPQGRMTFVQTVSQRRQTITGYQLNAGIE